MGRQLIGQPLPSGRLPQRSDLPVRCTLACACLRAGFPHRQAQRASRQTGKQADRDMDGTIFSTVHAKCVPNLKNMPNSFPLNELGRIWEQREFWKLSQNATPKPPPENKPMRKEFYNYLFINVVIGKVVRRERKMLQFSARVADCNSLQHHKKTPEKTTSGVQATHSAAGLIRQKPSPSGASADLHCPERSTHPPPAGSPSRASPLSTYPRGAVRPARESPQQSPRSAG